MKIAQVVSLQESVPPKGKNGLEFVVHYLTEELVKRGHQVTLFATKDSKTSARLIDVLPFPAARRGLFGWGGMDYLLTAMAKAAEMADEFDVIHTHIGSSAFYFADLIKTPIVETVHSPIYKVHKKNLLNKKLANKYCKDTIRRYKKGQHIFVSKNQMDSSALKINSKVIHNGISLNDFSFKKNPGDYFVYLGYITQNKGAHIAAQAARWANENLKLVGSYKGCEKYFEEKVKPYFQKNKIEYVGIASPAKRNKLLGGAKAILVPVQWEEPFGLIMIEAMACGTPVIGFNKAAVPEIVVDGKTGFVVDDMRKMVSAMKKIDQINRADCRAHVEKNFSVKKMVDEYEKIYEKIINQKR
ncbi:glycosyltransferase [Patescibacteria group bacterium]|nr:glycosyltransferase [Patescibacteria group bacterium]